MNDDWWLEIQSVRCYCLLSMATIIVAVAVAGGDSVNGASRLDGS